MVAYVHIEYSTQQFSEESKGGGWNPPPPGPCGTEKNVVLSRGLKTQKQFVNIYELQCDKFITSIVTKMLIYLR